MGAAASGTAAAAASGAQYRQLSARFAERGRLGVDLQRTLAPEGNAVAPEELPAQLLFVHAGQTDVKEVHWHAQIPGMLATTAADCFNLFKPANV